jgi:hypothetical protein
MNQVDEIMTRAGGGVLAIAEMAGLKPEDVMCQLAAEDNFLVVWADGEIGYPAGPEDVPDALAFLSRVRSWVNSLKAMQS